MFWLRTAVVRFFVCFYGNRPKIGDFGILACVVFLVIFLLWGKTGGGFRDGEYRVPPTGDGLKIYLFENF